MKLNLSKPDLRTLVLTGLSAVVLLWIYIGYVATPMFKNVVSLGQKARSQREELAALRLATANEAAIREQHQQLDETVMSLRKMMSPEEELPSVIEFLSDLASQTQVKIQTIFPQRPIGDVGEKDKTHTPATAQVVYKEIPIQIDAQASYHQLGTFLSLIEAGTKPMQLLTLRISTNPKEPRWHTINMVILAYFSVKPEQAGHASPTAHAPKKS